MSFTIGDFWKPKLQKVLGPQPPLLSSGWQIERKTNPSFVEAEISLRDGYDDISSPIWFVAAPGAVGKSTLAKEISAQTGAVYLDLALADTVAGNYLTGGLVKNGLLRSWQSNEAALLIDALDEARLRVTQKSFEDFLDDANSITKGRKTPTIIFGRVGIIEEAWLALSEKGLFCPIFDIQFFDRARAKKFVSAALDRIAKKAGYEEFAKSWASHRAVYESAAGDFIEGLERVAAPDGSRFAGYAPVLEAVATALAGVTNPASLSSTVQEAMRGQILQGLVNAILMRESSKLQLQVRSEIQDGDLTNLYSPEEQLQRLNGYIYGLNAPVSPPNLDTKYLAAYDKAVGSFLPNHPFLDGTGKRASGAVFSAALNAAALFSTSNQIQLAGESQAGSGPHTPNPFLIDFYQGRFDRELEKDPKAAMPPEHVVPLYESVRARALPGELVRLTVEGETGQEAADIEIQISAGSKGKPPKRIQLKTAVAGALRFGRQVSGVFVDAPDIDVVIGSGQPVEIIAPVSLSASNISFECPEIVVVRADSDSVDGAVFLEANHLASSKLTVAPIVRKGVELRVSWPGSNAYPWANFSTSIANMNAANLENHLRALRRLVLAFRSHSKGELARFKDKIEHFRMTKGAVGSSVREKLIADGILRLEGEMYFLDSTKLGKIVGATYSDLLFKRFNEQVRAYLAQLV